jgi:hypothetical protein
MSTAAGIGLILALIVVVLVVLLWVRSRGMLGGSGGDDIVTSEEWVDLNEEVEVDMGEKPTEPPAPKAKSPPKATEPVPPAGGAAVALEAAPGESAQVPPPPKPKPVPRKRIKVVKPLESKAVETEVPTDEETEMDGASEWEAVE